MAREFTATGTLDDIHQQIEVCAQRDAQAEGAKRKWGCSMAIGGLLAFAGIFAATAIAYLGIAMIAIGTIGLIACGIAYARESRHDFEDRKIESVRAFFRVVGQDMPRRAKCGFALRGGGLKQVDRKESGYTYVVKLEENWLETAGRLHDGNRFALSVDRTEWRKYKLKRKGPRLKATRVRERITLKLGIDADNYPNLAALSQGTAAGLAPGMAIDNHLVISRVVPPAPGAPQLLVVADCAQAVGYGEMLALMAAVYERLAAARAA